MSLYCHHCGISLSPEARFCSACGIAVNAAPNAYPNFAQDNFAPLVRPRLGRSIAGVCAGLANKYHWDVAAVRVITVLALIFTGGIVLVGYIACWVGIPEEPFHLPS